MIIVKQKNDQNDGTNHDYSDTNNNTSDNDNNDDDTDAMMIKHC